MPKCIRHSQRMLTVSEGTATSKSAASIPEWSGGYIPFARVEHCKYIVADNTKFWLGTSSCKKGYFHSLLSKLPVVCQARRSFGWLYRFFFGSGKTRLPKVRCQMLEYNKISRVAAV
jgi:hypothetical protein